MSRATSAIGRDVSITIFTASSLNSCVNFLRRSGILHPPFRAGLYWIRCPESPRHATASPRVRAGGARGWGRAAAAGGRWQEAVAGFTATVGLLGQVAPRSLA